MELAKLDELTQSLRLETENGNTAARSVFLPYKYLSAVKGKGLRSKLMVVSEFPFDQIDFKVCFWHRLLDGICFRVL